MLADNPAANSALSTFAAGGEPRFTPEYVIKHSYHPAKNNRRAKDSKEPDKKFVGGIESWSNFLKKWLNKQESRGTHVLTIIDMLSDDIIIQHGSDAEKAFSRIPAKELEHPRIDTRSSKHSMMKEYRRLQTVLCRYLQHNVSTTELTNRLRAVTLTDGVLGLPDLLAEINTIYSKVHNH